MITTKQGPLLQGEFRQRLINGAYSIRAAGIYQLDKNYFAHAGGTARAIATSAAAWKAPASSRSPTNGSGAGTA